MTFRVASIAMLAGIMSASQPAMAEKGDQGFFQQVAGRWQGPGEIIAGKYKGTKFVCTLDGAPERAKPGMSLDGTCNVGVFGQKMKASVSLQKGGYRGKFLDGAAGKGLDITSGNIDGERVVFSLHRAKLNGAMLARLADSNTMNVTISVTVDEKLIPVIGMSLKRLDTIKTSSVGN